MHVGIDQAWNQRATAGIDHLGPGGRSNVLTDLVDFVSRDDDRLSLGEFVARAVEDLRVLDDDCRRRIRIGGECCDISR